jgi:hypothetical protein
MGIRSAVFDNLNSALASGQFEPGGYLHGADADEIALDLVVFAADLDSQTDGVVLPFVQEWLVENNLHGTTKK